MSQAGLAFISINEVRDLIFTEHTDVYCLISVDRQFIRTSTSSADTGARAVEWTTEGYTFDITNDSSTISVVVWGVSTSYPTGRVLGQLVLSLQTLKTESNDNGNSVILVDGSSKPLPASLRYTAHYYVTLDKKVGFDDFVMIKFLGKGTFGKVMLVKKKDTSRLYAMKVMRKDKLYRESATALPLTERDVLKRYNHPYVVHLKYAFQTETHLYMVMDYLSGGDLFELMSNKKMLDEDTTRFYAAQMVLAVSFLHEHDIIYRDLKPENLLLDMVGNMCLVDFGLCKEGMLGDQVTHTFCGSLQYMAPEVLKGEGYGKSVDWWALGVIIYEMLTGMHPFIKSRTGSFTDREIIHGIVHEDVQFSTRVSMMSKSAIKLLSNLLQKDPRKRLGSGSKGYEDIKKHSFFSGINWKKLAKKDVMPPFKPHLGDCSFEKHKDPWANMSGYSSSPAFEILNDAQQECFDSFSYTAPTELARARSSPVFRLKAMSSSGSPRSFTLASSPLANGSSPRSPRVLMRESSSPGALNSPPSSPLKMVRSPGFSGLSNICESDESGDEELEEDLQELAFPRRQRRRWSLSNFQLKKGEGSAEDDKEGEEEGEGEKVENVEDPPTSPASPTSPSSRGGLLRKSSSKLISFMNNLGKKKH